MREIRNVRAVCLYVFVILINTVHNAASTNCYTCLGAYTTKQCMENAPRKCSWGEICYKTVERGGIAGKTLTKGCMAADRCYKLESLNHVTICKQDPSVCVYCCTGELCNGSGRTHVLLFSVVLWIPTLYSSVSLTFSWQ